MDEKEKIRDLEFELGAAYQRITHLEKLATMDELTGLGNRRGLNAHLSRELAQADRYKTDLTFVAIDIDHFKQVNDTHGHGVGDAVLMRIAEVLRQVIRGGDAAFRQGGEELSVVAVTSYRGAALLGEKIRATIESSHQRDNDPAVTVSVGVAMAGLGDTAEDLAKRADDALYKAKENGRNRVEIG